VSPLRNPTIAPARQLGLVLPDSQGTWPDQIWDSLPEEVRREVLVRLANLLNRWFENQRSLP
jgi:hypothetical protein